MREILLEAFWLLIVGMGSAFFVLFLIGVSGKILINILNRSEEGGLKSPETTRREGNSIHAAHLAVISAAVEEVTRGEGSVQSIQKIEI